MNYKLIKDHFTEITQKNGVIENNSNGIVEFSITKDSEIPKPYDTSNKVIEKNGKMNYSLESNQKLWGRSYNRIYACINVFEYEDGNADFDPNQYYTKTKTDELFVKKDGSKVLSDNNYTNEDKEKLGKLNYATENPLANGTANVGVSEKLAREDHTHPSQTTITGNAGTATKLQTPRAIKLTGAITGTANFDGSAEANISTTLGNIDGSKINALTGYVKGANSNAIAVSDSLLVALGKLEKGVEEAKTLPASMSLNSVGNTFKIHYCTKSQYDTLEKIQDDSTIYMILDETTGNITLKCYRP